MPVRRIPASVGLVTDPSALAVPVGAMREATNVIMHRGVLQPRPGFGDLDGIKEPAPVTVAFPKPDWFAPKVIELESNVEPPSITSDPIPWLPI